MTDPESYASKTVDDLKEITKGIQEWQQANTPMGIGLTVAEEGRVGRSRS